MILQVGGQYFMQSTEGRWHHTDEPRQVDCTSAVMTFKLRDPATPSEMNAIDDALAAARIVQAEMRKAQEEREEKHKAKLEAARAIVHGLPSEVLDAIALLVHDTDYDWDYGLCAYDVVKHVTGRNDESA